MNRSKGKEIDFSQYPHSLTTAERNLLNSIIYEMAEIKALSKWAYYNANWIKRDMAAGKKIA